MMPMSSRGGALGTLSRVPFLLRSVAVSHCRAGLRLLVTAGIALPALTASEAAALTLQPRPTPIQLIGAQTGCPTAAQASGADVTDELRRLVSERQPEAAEALVDAMLRRPGLIVGACDPGRAASGVPIPPITGTVGAPTATDEVGSGWRMVGGSRWSPNGAAQVGDRFALPELSAGATVDVAVRTTTGVSSLRPALPADFAPSGVEITGSPSAPVVAITGVGGQGPQRIETAVSVPARAAKLRLRAEGDRLARSKVVRLRVTAPPGSIVFGTTSMPSRRGKFMQGRGEPSSSRDALFAAVAGPDGRARLAVPRPTPSAGRRDYAVDRVVVLAVHPDRRVIDGGHCSFAVDRKGRVHGNAKVRCRRDLIGSLQAWTGFRNVAMLRTSLAGRVDATFGIDGLLGSGVPYAFAGTIANDLEETLAAPARRVVRRPEASTQVPPAVRAAASSIGPVARGVTVDTFEGDLPVDRDDILGAAPGGLGVGDLNGDGRPDLLVGSDYPLVFLSTTAGALRFTEFDPGGDGGWLAGDLDGDGTEDLVDALGHFLVSSRSWATTPPKMIGPALDELGAPGQLPWSDAWSGWGAGPTPLADSTGDGRRELLGDRAIYVGESFVAGSSTLLPITRPADGSVREQLVTDLQTRSYFGDADLSERPQPARVLTAPRTEGALLADVEPVPPSTSERTPWRSAGLLRVRSIDPRVPGGLGPWSAPITVRSVPSLVDHGSQGDWLLRATLVDCDLERSCDEQVRLRADGSVRVSVSGAKRPPRCAFIDDGPDPDQDQELLCGRQGGNEYAPGSLVVVPSGMTGRVDVQQLPRVTFEGKVLRIDYGAFDVGAVGGRHVVAVTRPGKRASDIVLIDRFE